MATTSTTVKLKDLKRTDFQNIVDAIYPVGSIYMSVNNTSPSTLFGGTQEQLKDKFLLASGSKALGTTGGEAAHTLTIDEMPSHGHEYRQMNVSGSWTVGSGLVAIIVDHSNKPIRPVAVGLTITCHHISPLICGKELLKKWRYIYGC